MTQEGEEGRDEIPGFQEDRSRRPDSWIGEGGRESRKVDVQGPGKTLVCWALSDPISPGGGDVSHREWRGWGEHWISGEFSSP